MQEKVYEEDMAKKLWRRETDKCKNIRSRDFNKEIWADLTMFNPNIFSSTNLPLH